MALADFQHSLKNKAAISKQSIFKPDFNQNEWTDPSNGNATNKYYSKGMHELKHDLSSMMNTRGSSGEAKYSTLKVKQLDVNLAKELASPTYNSFNKDSKFSYENKQRRLSRLKAMEALHKGKSSHVLF